jgi:hypothetical protein
VAHQSDTYLVSRQKFRRRSTDDKGNLPRRSRRVAKPDQLTQLPRASLYLVRMRPTRWATGRLPTQTNRAVDRGSSNTDQRQYRFLRVR